MSDETRHPERRAGQKWVCHWRESDHERATIVGDKLTSHGTWKMDDGTYWHADRWTGKYAGEECTMTLLADAPATPQSSAPVVDRAFHFCGLLCWAQGCKIGGIPSQMPPLAAQPAEAKRQPCCVHAEDSDFDEHDDDCPAAANAKPAEQPKPAAKAACNWKPRSVPCGGQILVRQMGKQGWSPQPTCEAHYLHNESLMIAGNPSGILRDPAISERIAKPPMAHSCMWPDDDGGL